MVMLKVDSRPFYPKLSGRGTAMEVFEKKDKKSSDSRQSDLITKKPIVKSIVKSIVKAEIITVAENGPKIASDPQSSLSPDQPPSSSQIPLQRTIGRVIISLENLIIPENRLHPTPSMLEGLDSRTEWHLRRLGCDMIQHSGILLKLPQTAMATAQVLYQRFYHIKSFLRNDYFNIAMACIYMASKVEEFPKRLRDIISVFTHVRQTLCQEPIEPVILDYGYVNLKNQVIKCERRLLKELGFCVHVKHPHKLICMYLQVLNLDENNIFVQRAWNYMNDSLRTDLFVRYSPEAIACGCIFLTARKLQIPLPRDSSWSSLFGITKADMEDIATNVLLLYSIKLPPVAEIEGKITTMRKAMDAVRAKGLLGSVIDQEADRTPDSVQTTPEDPARLDRERRNSKDRASADREKRPRESSDERGSRDSKHRRRDPLPDVRHSRRSRSRSYERKRSREVIRVRSKERKRSQSPVRRSRDEKSRHTASPGLPAKRERIYPPRREDERRRSHSKEPMERRRSRSRTPDRSHRRDRRY